MTLVTGNVSDASGRPDDTPWAFWSVTLRNSPDDDVITTKRRPVTPVGGMLAVELEPGNVAVQMPTGDIVYCAVPDQDEYGLWELIEESVPYPVGTSFELLAAAVETHIASSAGLFQTVAVPSESSPGMAQWMVATTGELVGDPVPWSQVVSEAVVQIAADAAVTEEIADRDILEADDPRIAAFQTVNLPGDRALIIKDPDQNIVAWVNTAGEWFFKIADGTVIPGAFEKIPAYGVRWGIRDAADNLLIWLDDRGRFHVSELVAGNAFDEVLAAMTSGPDIVCWGDSMTAGAGATTVAQSYPGVLQTLVPAGVTVRRMGVGGETSVMIAARASAIPMRATPVGGSIPASGAVELVVEQNNGRPLTASSSWTNANWSDVVFGGVAGAVTYNSGTATYSFSRATAGSAVPVNEPQAVVNRAGTARRDDIHILWLGENNKSWGDSGLERARTDTAAIIQEMTSAQKRFIVMNLNGSVGAVTWDQDAEDAKWHDLYGRRYLAARKMLVQYGLAEMGITPTTQDLADIAAGVVPTSLRVDSVHLNDSGYAALARFIYRRLTEFGWV